MGVDRPQTQSSGTQTGAGDRRTSLAEERTLYAVERTYAAWQRTGMGALALAIGTRELLGRGGPTLAVRATSTLFVLAALMIFLFGHMRARKMVDSLPRPRELPHRGHFTRLTGLLLVATAAVGTLIWLR